MWGQVYQYLGILQYFRIIPTRVGTSDKLCTCSCVLRDHPHACGDKLRADSTFFRISGSSPRVWGQVSASDYKVIPTRIIPTRVGTRMRCIRMIYRMQDHPHACGDKLIVQLLFFGFKGSSPRVWGQVFPKPAHRDTRRIIPTRVGTSVLFLPCCCIF